MTLKAGMSGPGFAWITLAVCLVWLALDSGFALHQSPATQLLGMASSLVALGVGLIALVRMVTGWPRDGWRVLVPPVICATAVIASMVTGPALQRAAFHRSLPAFEAVIRQMESGPIPVTTELRRIPQAESSLVPAVLARRTTNGVLIVEFLTGFGFPAKHSGYLYCSSTNRDLRSDPDHRWARFRQWEPHWFRISD